MMRKMEWDIYQSAETLGSLTKQNRKSLFWVRVEAEGDEKLGYSSDRVSSGRGDGVGAGARASPPGSLILLLLSCCLQCEQGRLPQGPLLCLTGNQPQGCHSGCFSVAEEPVRADRAAVEKSSPASQSPCGKTPTTQEGAEALRGVRRGQPGQVRDPLRTCLKPTAVVAPGEVSIYIYIFKARKVNSRSL